jgi:hypothetical protein
MTTTIRLVVVAAASVSFAVLLGWLKGFYYLQTLGIDPALIPGTPLVWLRESWFVVQNLGFLLLMGWVALRTRRWWWIGALVLYASLPLASHYAFAVPEWPAARFLIAYRHTLLKFAPFAALAIAWLADRSRRTELACWPRRWRAPAGVLLVFLAASWAISAAKHFGSFDANRALTDPGRFLPRVRLERSPEWAGVRAGDVLHLVTASAEQLFLLAPGRDGEVRILVVSRRDATPMESVIRRRVQPADQYL